MNFTNSVPRLADQNSHRLLHLGKTAEMWNEVLRLHQQETPGCTGLLSWDLASEERRGLGSRMGLRCTKCTYSSRRYNLYEEVDTKSPGRKAAKINYGLQVGLSQTPVGNDGMRKILLCTNTPPPARRSLMRALVTINATPGSVGQTFRCIIR